LLKEHMRKEIAKEEERRAEKQRQDELEKERTTRELNELERLKAETLKKLLPIPEIVIGVVPVPRNVVAPRQDVVSNVFLRLDVKATTTTTTTIVIITIREWDRIVTVVIPLRIVIVVNVHRTMNIAIAFHCHP